MFPRNWGGKRRFPLYCLIAWHCVELGSGRAFIALSRRTLDYSHNAFRLTRKNRQRHGRPAGKTVSFRPFRGSPRFSAAVAQWIEYWPPKPRVVGSIPASRATFPLPRFAAQNRNIGLPSGSTMHPISCSQSKFPHSRQKANGNRRAPLLYQPGTTPDTKLLKQQRILPGNSMPALRDRYFARYQSGAIGLFLSVQCPSPPGCVAIAPEMARAAISVA